MKSLILSLLALHLALLPPALAIFGGSAVTNIPPWPVYLTRSQSPNKPFCGGSLITKDAVLTAGHCVEELDPNVLSVSNTDGETVPVKSIVLHPDYDNSTITNDIAILRLAKPLSVTEYAPLNSNAENPAVATWVNLTGWGGTGLQKRSTSTELQTVSTVVVPLDTCVYYYGSMNSSQHICTYVPGGGSTERDEGGPVTDQDGVVVGIIAPGTAPRPQYPGVYTRVGIFVDWIRSKGFAPNITEL